MGVEVFGSAMIERYLRARGYRFFRAEDGEFLVLLKSDAGQLQAYLKARGSRADVFSVRVKTSERYPVRDRTRLVELANKWNVETRWPKASVRETSDGSKVRVVGESEFPLMDGVHFELLTRLADNTISSAVGLFGRVEEEMRLPSVQTLEDWFRSPASGPPLM